MHHFRLVGLLLFGTGILAVTSPRSTNNPGAATPPHLAISYHATRCVSISRQAGNLLLSLTTELVYRLTGFPHQKQTGIHRHHRPGGTELALEA